MYSWFGVQISTPTGQSWAMLYSEQWVADDYIKLTVQNPVYKVPSTMISLFQWNDLTKWSALKGYRWDGSSWKTLSPADIYGTGR